MNVPDKVKLSPNLYKRLVAVNTEHQVLYGFFKKTLEDEDVRSKSLAQQVFNQVSARAQELVLEGQKVWEDIEKETGIDRINVNWVVSEDRESIRPHTVIVRP
jgi:hypothetical protein